MDYKIVGECFWLSCNIDGCSVKISVKVAHYRPDLVASVYPHIKSHPWTEAKTIVESALELAVLALPGSVRSWLQGQGSEPSTQSLSMRTRNMRYFEVDVIGHPVISFNAPGLGYVCGSVTRPFITHYTSLTDLLMWRNPEAENLVPASLIPGFREVGAWPAFTWGSVYPRSGWIVQPSPPKAAAIIAQRGADIAINGGALRTRIALSSGSVNLWPPPPIRETDASTAKWQMLHPVKERNCSVFGTNDLYSLSDWGGGKVDSKNSYLWSIWRPYKCCPRRGQVFLGSDDSRSYP